jgi:hypothetical protein
VGDDEAEEEVIFATEAQSYLGLILAPMVI